MLNLYSSVTAYRGIQYDVNRVELKSAKTVTITYRGVTYTKEVK